MSKRPVRPRSMWWRVLGVALRRLSEVEGGGRLRLIALIEEPAVVGRILRHLGLPVDLPVARPARAPPLLAVAEAHENESAP